MRSAITLSVAALAGSALAAPSYGRPARVHYEVQVDTVVKTVYVTEGYPALPQKPKPSKYQPAYPAPAETTMVYEAPAPAPTSSSVYAAPPAPTSEAPVATPTMVYTQAPKPTSVYTPAPEPTTETPEPTSEAPKPTATKEAAPAGDDYMSVVDEWRAKLGLSKLECSKELEKNAMNVVVEGNGVMKHKLNPGTFAQVLAPGKPGVKNFEDVFVGGWLCEISTLPGLDGACTTFSKGWNYEGQTGHAEILTSPNYSKIGCQIYEDIWCCDLA